jgi:GTPase SAR1 family protein
MITEGGFPLMLLQQPIVDRLKYFRHYTMAHPKLLEASQTLMYTLEEPAGIALMFLFGPTGVGKSTLLQRITQKIIEAALPTLEQDFGRIPIAGIEAAAPEFGNFDWKDLYLRGLKAVKDPCIKLPEQSRLTSLKLRAALEAALRHRQVRVFYIDEAQNLGNVASGRKLRDQTDCIKSLANLTGVPFILAGTYDLLVLRNLSAQLCRRSLDIHLPRYQAEKTEDLRSFRGIIQTFQRHLPLIEEPDLLSHWEFCYERSVGCVGILKDWLARSLTAAMSEGSKTMTVRHLETCAWSLDQCMVMLKEAREGEQQLEPRTNYSVLRMALGLDSPAVQECPTVEPLKKKRQRNSVGQPLPQRRPVGGQKGVP